MLRAGSLDRRIDIERATAAADALGQPIETWAKLASNLPAALTPVAGEERFAAEQFVASEQVEFRVRWSSSLATLNPRDRVIYPPTTSAPAAASIYDIMGVLEVGRREALRIMTARRAE